jgi:hypothetical protein
MSIDRKLDDWVAAGLIDPAAADRIRAHEASGGRPTALWAIAGLGLLALALGILLVISANWDRITDEAKLGVHMALLAAAGAAHLLARRRRLRWPAEAALFLFAALVLGGIALQAQVFQLTGPAWHALLLWLALVAPALLIGGETRLTGTLFAAAALLGPIAMAADTVDRGGVWRLAQGATMAVPALLIGLSFLPRLLPTGFRLALRQTGILVSLAAASIAHFAWASRITPAQAGDNALRFLPPLLAALAALALARRSDELPRELHLPLLAGPVLSAALALAIPHPDTLVSRLAGVLVFIALWAAIARAAAASSWNALFAVAIAAIGLRIFIIYLELFGSLAATGGGLMLGGALLVALSFAWHRIVGGRRTP